MGYREGERESTFRQIGLEGDRWGDLLFASPPCTGRKRSLSASGTWLVLGEGIFCTRTHTRKASTVSLSGKPACASLAVRGRPVRMAAAARYFRPTGAVLHLLIGALQFTGRSDSGAELWDDDSNGELGFIDISPPRKLDLTSPVARCYRVVAGWRPPQNKVQLSRWMCHVNRRAVEVRVRGIGKV